MLLDEPLSALDARVRADLRRELREVQQQLGIPTLMVTHDQEEAMTMADKVICMQGGRIMQAGSPRELYTTPKTRFVAEFMGHSNLLPVELVQSWLPSLLAEAPADADAKLFIRPEHIAIAQQAQAEGEVRSISFLGSIQRLDVAWRNHRVLVETSSIQPWSVGDRVDLSVDPSHCIWMSA